MPAMRFLVGRSQGLQAVIEARLILGETGGHMQRRIVRHQHHHIARVADLPQVPLHRVAEIDRDVQFALALGDRLSQRRKPGDAGDDHCDRCTSRPRTCWTQAEIAAARVHPAASAAASFSRIA